MLALRCTKRLLDKLPPSLGSASVQAPGALGHWYANLLQIHSKPHVLALSERSLLCVVLPAAPYANLLARFLSRSKAYFEICLSLSHSSPQSCDTTGIFVQLLP